MLTTKLTRSKFQRREMKKLGKPTTRSKAVLEKTVLKVTLPELQEIEKSIARCLQCEGFKEELQFSAT